jgi:5-methylthioadenosine/S-adenosylhomocysteine deaminase
MKPRMLVKCGCLITMEPGATRNSAGHILIEAGKIIDVGPEIDAPDAQVIDAGDMIVLPGFVDTHRHTWQTCVRHRCVDIHPPVAYFEEMMFRRGPRYRPEDVWIANYLGALGAIDSGVTTMLDWSQIQNTPEHSDAAVDALRQSGIRAVFGHGWSLTQADSRTPNSARPHPADIARLRREQFASDDSLLTLVMAARGPEITDSETWRADLRLARELGIRSSIHMGAFAFNGAKRGIAEMNRFGMLGEDLTFIHCSTSGDDELQMIADNGVTVSLGVNVEMNAQGIGDIPLDRLLALGVRPSLSGDTETLGSADMFTQMRSALAYYRSYVGGGHSRAANAPETLTTHDVLEFATVEGARANGLSQKVGTIAPGKSADIVMVRSNDINLMPVIDPVAAIVSGSHPGNVDTVMIEGRILKQGGKLVGVDLADIRQRARQSQDYVLAG